ncbi:MAG TPA: anti-sigma regulatory factor [Eubacteriaceae bacterium]|jgi:serine/threonine-protein kinase RsbT|nr:anti-sigma regulatory factor [Eubacteriaceae bacterium]
MYDKIFAEYIFTISHGNFEMAGSASSSIKKILKHMEMGKAFIRRVCIACYEVEMNMVIHSIGGKIRLEILPNGVTIIAEDFGPGIPDIEKALKDGFSTASKEIISKGFGAGRGFSNIKLNSDRFNINSQVGKGTRLELLFIFRKE